MSLITGLALVLLVPMAAVALLNVVAAARLHRVRPSPDGPLVSVLVPARDEAANLRRLLPALARTRYRNLEVLVLDDGSRDEAANLRRLLPALARTRYRNLEVLVLDDGSRDETAAVVRGHAASDPRFRLVEGLDPPDGWTGKNWACHQLSHYARGDLLLFCDADVVPGPEAVGRTATLLREGDADVMTAFPRHERGGWLEEALIPLVTQLPIAALLPLPLVGRTGASSLAVGNGQWLAWRRESYDRLGRHARVRDSIVEDVALARLAKAAGLRLVPVLATRDLRIRMYDDAAGTWSGFARNLYPLLGGGDGGSERRDGRALLVGGALVAALALPFIAPAVGTGAVSWLPLALLGLVRLAGAALFAASPRGVLLHPVGVVSAAALALVSRHRHRQGAVAWKGRPLILERAP
jgi:chlorobactene glucosyltransferase